VAINKLLLTVSDRLERERIDHANAEREIEAAERAEEAEIRAAWNKQEQPLDNNNNNSMVGGSSTSVLPPTSSMRNDASQKMRIVRRLPQRTNFEVPFFDEDDSDRYRLSNNNARSLGDNEAVKVQKAIFEKQRYELNKMRTVSASIGAAVFRRLLECQVMDLEELQCQQQSLLLTSIDATNSGIMADQANQGSSINAKRKEGGDDVDMNSCKQPSSVLEVLEKEGRGPLQIKFTAVKKSTKKRQNTSFLSEGFE
jgi:hypothetical protein